jgi:hypothetical protein
MEYTSAVLTEMDKLGGERCCKRNAFLSLSVAAKYAKKFYGIEIELGDIHCDFSSSNAQCLKEKCPFHPIHS